MTRNLTRYILVLVLLTATTPVQAQFPRSTLIQVADAVCDFSSYTGNWIGADNVDWICYVGRLPLDAHDLLDGLHNELAEFGKELLEDWLADALSTVGNRVDASEIETALDHVRDAMREGPRELRAAVRDAVEQMFVSNMNAPRAADFSPAWWGEEARRQNPNIAMSEMHAEKRRLRAAEARTEAAMAHEASLELAEQVGDAQGTQEAVMEVLRPEVPGGPNPGTAAQLEDRARTATSTRAAIQALSEGIADLMRQDAVFSGAMIEHLRVLSQQQVYTTWQLQLAVNSLTEQLEDEVSKRQFALRQRISRAYLEGDATGQSFKSFSDDLGVTLNPNFDHMSWDDVGW